MAKELLAGINWSVGGEVMPRENTLNARVKLFIEKSGVLVLGPGQEKRLQ